MGKIETYYCDVCETKKNKPSCIGIQVIFMTEQTEGRSVKPYLSDEVIDICEKCLDHVIARNYIYAHGAQGFNKYYFKNKGENNG